MSKLKDRGTHQAFGVVTNAQDFMHILRLYVEREIDQRRAALPLPRPTAPWRHRGDGRDAHALPHRDRAQLPVERVVEMHLFPAIRQGGMESGVAVLALDLATEPKVEPENVPPAAPRIEPEDEPRVAPEVEPDVRPQSDPEIDPRVEPQPDDEPGDLDASSPYASAEEAAAVAEQLEEAEEAEQAAEVDDDDDAELLAEFDERDGRADPDEPPARRHAAPLHGVHGALPSHPQGP